MMNGVLVLCFCFVLLCQQAHANNETNDQADQVITNPLLRASSGSLSKWSLNTFWNYSAGSLANPSGAERPNILGAGDVPLLQSLDANLGINYRLGTLDRLTLGIGITSLAPFHSSLQSDNSSTQQQFDENNGKIEVNDINLTYTRLANIKGFETLFSTSFIKYKRDFLEKTKGYDYALGLNINSMYNQSSSPWYFGFAVDYRQNFFSKDKDQPLDPLAGTLVGSRQARYSFLIKPQMEYMINDTFNLRTSFRSWWIDSFRDQESWSATSRPFSQSLRLGISATRDIFFSVGMEFLPEDLRADKTIIATEARINLY